MSQVDKILLKSFSLSGIWSLKCWRKTLARREKRRQNVKCCLLWHGTQHKVACARWKRRQNRGERACTRREIYIKKVRVIKESVCVCVMYSAGKGPAWWMAARLCVIDAAFCAAGKEEKKRWSRRRSRPEENRWLESACWPDSSLTHSPDARTKNQSRKQKKSKHAIEKTNTKTITAQPIQRHSHKQLLLCCCSLSKLWTSSREPRKESLLTIHFGTKCAAMALSTHTKSRFQGSWIFDHSFSSYWNLYLHPREMIACRIYGPACRVNCCVHSNLSHLHDKIQILSFSK